MKKKNPIVYYQKARITVIPIDHLNESDDPTVSSEMIGDNGAEVDRQVGELTAEYLFSRLTKRQRMVAALLTRGYTRKETAKHLGVSHQAIHQIVIRMRRRIKGATWSAKSCME